MYPFEHLGALARILQSIYSHAAKLAFEIGVEGPSEKMALQSGLAVWLLALVTIELALTHEAVWKVRSSRASTLQRICVSLSYLGESPSLLFEILNFLHFACALAA